MMKRIAANAAALLLFFCIAPSSQAKDRLAIGYTSASGVFAGLWIAQEAKLFDKYNIDSHLILIASGSLMVQSMLGGDLPISAAAGSASVDAALAGSDLTMFGALGGAAAGPVAARRPSAAPPRRRQRFGRRGARRLGHDDVRRARQGAGVLHHGLADRKSVV